MAWKIGEKALDTFCKLSSVTNTITIRNGHHLRGKPPGIARSLQQRLLEENKEDEELTSRVDIGLPSPEYSRPKQNEERLNILKSKRSTQDPGVQEIQPIDLDKVRKQWLETSGQQHIKQIADHYGIFEHLFDVGKAYFYPRVPLQIRYSTTELDYPVYYGNVLKPRDTQVFPKVAYDSDNNTLWTLILTNLDGNFVEENKECVHWMLGNIPGNNVEKGEIVVPYLQPFPPKGTGYQRFVFLLYKQTKKMDYSQFSGNDTNKNLKLRSFSTYEFYKTRQNELTPSGLAFFQSDWEESLHDFYHTKLNIKEPIYEYNFDPPYIAPQKWFPLRQPFNLYMDKYRDPKQINKEFLVRKLKNVHPFKPDPKPIPYPNAQYFDGYVPTWLKLEIRKSRLKWGRINDIE